MRKMAVVLALVLTACACTTGALKRGVVTGCNLTVRENKEFRELKGKDAERTCFFLPMFYYQRQVGLLRSGRLAASNYEALAVVPLPVIDDVEYYSFTGAVFNDKGEREIRTHGCGLSPLFNFAEMDTRKPGGEWQHYLSRARFCQILGFGDYRGRKFFQFVLIFGKDRMSIEEETPGPILPFEE